MASTRENVVFYLNHERIVVSGAEVFESLSNWLRYRKAMTGTKVVCSEGDCGACTVILGWMNPVGKLEYRIVDSCIQFLFQLDCCHIITIEALEKEGKLHPAQQTMVDCFGSQCGFCTPGFVMGLAHLCETKQNLTTVDIREKLAGNLCRCTGYEAIVKAGLELNKAPVEKITQRFEIAAMEKDFGALVQQSVKVAASSGEVFFKPVDLAEALKLRSSMPQLRIVAGATDLGVQHNKGKSLLTQVMFIAHLHEIATVKQVSGKLEIGAAANWSDVLAITEKSLPELHGILKIFAAEQIRNAATIGGNIINASPIADSLACLFALDARLVVVSTTGVREVSMKHFYSGYKKFDLKPDELLTKIILPLPKPDTLFKLYKVSKRRDLDISAVTLAIYLKVAGDKIAAVDIAAGGVAATIIALPAAMKALEGAVWSEETFRRAGEAAAAEINPLSDVRGSAHFRKILIRNLFLKFYHESTDAATVKAG